ncbi:MAG TPA: hypothetical protein VF624_10495 [Tepidisphaeraceae bacterium]
MISRSSSFERIRREPIAPAGAAPASAALRAEILPSATSGSSLPLPPWALATGAGLSGDCRLISVRCRAARAAGDADFARGARDAYRLLREQASSLGKPWPVRAWNFVPGIHDASCDGDRYMTFNIGRHKAMSDWFGSDLARLAPAATGVGHDGADLEIHALVASQPGIAIENAQQVPAYRYSGRYGRLPPCFARATRAGHRLMISGTAAVLGEDSRHADSFDRQLRLAMSHLLNVARDGLGARPRFEHVRVYLPSTAADACRSEVAAQLLAALGEPAIEFVAADLCRKELLIEIEAVATTCPEDRST